MTISTKGFQSIERFVGGAGQGNTYGLAFGSEINSVVNGNAIMSSLIIDNTVGDVFCDVSGSFSSFTSGAGNPVVSIYIYPLNQDNSTYGDGRFVAPAAGPPLGAYFAGNIPLIPSVTQIQQGSYIGITLPFTKFAFVMYNVALGTLGSTNFIKYRTYNRSFFPALY